MKKRAIMTTVIFSLCLICWNYTVSAQGFATVIKKLESFDSRLSKLESSKDESLQKLQLDISKLQQKLDKFQPGQGQKEFQTSIAELRKLVKNMGLKVDNLSGELENYRANAVKEESESLTDENSNPESNDSSEEPQEPETVVENTQEDNGEELQEEDKEQPVIESTEETDNGDDQDNGDENPVSDNEDVEAEEPEEEGDLEEFEGPVFLGFFDISAADFSDRENPWGLGPFELDLEYSYGENFAGGGAFVFEDGAVDLGVAFIDFHKYDSKIAARGRIFYDPGIHVQVGRFDIPFGLDYRYFATPDRETITPPLLTDFIMDGGWNDLGLRVYGSHSFLDFSFFSVNGFNEGITYGGRVGFFPLRDPFKMHRTGSDKPFEIGVSYALDTSIKTKREETIIGYDIESTFYNLELRGEYLKRESIVEDFVHSGYYVSAKYNFDFFSGYSIVNFGQIELNKTDKVKRLLLGLTFEIQGYSALKFEYSKFLNTDLSIFEDEIKDNLFNTKLVLSF